MQGSRNINHIKKEALPLKDFVSCVIDNCLHECFQSLETASLCETLKALDCFVYHDVFIYKAIRLSLDQPRSKQQWLSEALTVLFDLRIITTAQSIRAFEKLIQQADDIELDVPDVHWSIVEFIECAKEDGLLSKDFLERLPELFLQKLLASAKTEEQRNQIENQLSKLKAYKNGVKAIAAEFLASGSLEDFPHDLEKLNRKYLRHEAVRCLIKAAATHTPAECEILSKALSNNYGNKSQNLTSEDILIGFLRLLGDSEDYKIDSPSAPTIFAKFFARAISDELLPVSLATDTLRLSIGGETGRAISLVVKEWFVEATNTKSFDKFQRIWFSNEFERQEIRSFKQEVHRILQDHFADRDTSATCSALNALYMQPDEGVEFIRRTLEFALDQTPLEQSLVIKLFSALLTSNVINESWIRLGFDETIKRLPEIKIDYPDGEKILFQLKEKVFETCCIETSLSR